MGAPENMRLTEVTKAGSLYFRQGNNKFVKNWQGKGVWAKGRKLV